MKIKPVLVKDEDRIFMLGVAVIFRSSQAGLLKQLHVEQQHAKISQMPKKYRALIKNHEI